MILYTCIYLASQHVTNRLERAGFSTSTLVAVAQPLLLAIRRPSPALPLSRRARGRRPERVVVVVVVAVVTSGARPTPAARFGGFEGIASSSSSIAVVVVLTSFINR